MANDRQVRWRLGGKKDGAPQSLTFETTAHAEEARALVRAHRQMIDRESLWATVMDLPLSDEEPGQPAVETLVGPWLASKHEMTPGVRRRYRLMFDFAVLPTIGHLAVNKVDAGHIDQVIAWLNTCDCSHGIQGPVCKRRKGRKNGGEVHTDGLKKATIDRYYVAMQGFFTHLVKRGYIKQNPVTATEWKPTSLARYNATRKEDAHFYMEKAEYRLLRSAMDIRYRAFIELLVRTGMRFGEATALKVRNVRPNSKPMPSIEVVDAWKTDEEGKWYVGLPKGNVVRTIFVQKELTDLLAPLMVGKSPDDLVITAPRGGRLTSAGFWNEFWTPAVISAMRCDLHPVPSRATPVSLEDLLGPTCGHNGGVSKRKRACGTPVTPGWNRCIFHMTPDPLAVSTCQCWDRRLPKKPLIHDLRHTFAATLIKDGHSLIAVAAQLGHGSSLITEKVYAGLLPSSLERMAASTNMDLD